MLDKRKPCWNNLLTRLITLERVGEDRTGYYHGSSWV